MIRVGIDARLIDLPGIGRYIRCLLKGLDNFGGKEIEVLAYLPSNASSANLYLQNLQIRRIGVPPYSLVEQIYWPWRIHRDGLQVFHAPHYVFPLFAPVPLIVTLHDVVYWRYRPKGIQRIPLRIYYHFMHRMAASRAKVIITDSEFSYQEITDYLKIEEPTKVIVIPGAVDPDIKRPPDEIIHRVRDYYRLPESFILYVGTNKPWKNLETLLEVLVRLREIRPDCLLVIAGKRGRNEENLQTMVQKMGLENSVLLLGEVPETDLPALYSAARMVVCPSMYEGFGLVPLEAMACGTPVIASNAASLPEVVDQAAILVNPRDVMGWVEAIIRLWDDSVLSQKLSNMALNWVKNFTVEHMAQRIITVYRGVLE